MHAYLVFYKFFKIGVHFDSQAFYPIMEDRSRTSSNEFCSNHRMNIA